MVAGRPSASFFLSPLSLVFMTCGIMNMMNYIESVACGCGSQRSSWTGPSLSLAFCGAHTRRETFAHPHAQTQHINPAARGLSESASDTFGSFIFFICPIGFQGFWVCMFVCLCLFVCVCVCAHSLASNGFFFEMQTIKSSPCCFVFHQLEMFLLKYE